MMSYLRKRMEKRDEDSQMIPLISPPLSEKDVVLYYTSSRVVRKTFTECNAVINILKILGIPFQERDVFITRKYLGELKEIFGTEVSLPQLFVKGKYVGGFRTIMELNDFGRLKKIVEDYINQRPRRACGGCGDFRYIICFVCCGSKKIFLEEREEIVDCWVCNENGLLACPDCSLGGIEAGRYSTSGHH